MISATTIAEHRVGARLADARERERHEREQRDEDVAAGVRRVGEQQRAVERPPAPPLEETRRMTFTASDATSSAPSVAARRRARADAATAPPTLWRSSSKHEIERKPTMPSVPSVSNFSWP